MLRLLQFPLLRATIIIVVDAAVVASLSLRSRVRIMTDVRCYHTIYTINNIYGHSYLIIFNIYTHLLTLYMSYISYIYISNLYPIATPDTYTSSIFTHIYIVQYISLVLSAYPQPSLCFSLPPCLPNSFTCQLYIQH